MSINHRPTEHLDVLIVGAGLSGVAAGYHLQQRCPNRTYAILEGRDNSGGTWDLFRYPGVRSDSDMQSLGYSFRPWTQARAIADGASILDYVRSTARNHGIDRKIRFNHRVKRASWSTAAAKWTVEVERRATDASFETVCFTCNFLFMCSGYYSYAQGYTPEFPGIERFAGAIVHPQQWTHDIEYAGKRVVVIGSGATAITLVPEIAKAAAHVTMLQRSPSYVISMPTEDRIAKRLRRYLSARAAYRIVRWKNVLSGMLFFHLSRRSPQRMKEMILAGIKRKLGADYDIARHFTPHYQPWDQRLCVAADGDLFEAIRGGRAAVVTDHIETFTPTGIRLRSGTELPADLIVTATGLEVVILGEVQLEVDGRQVHPAKTRSYLGMMYSDVPNLASALGYTNAAWTLKCELSCEYVCRLLNYMDKSGYRQCTPRYRHASRKTTSQLDFTPGYILRAIDKFPRHGARAPWKLSRNYLRDFVRMKFGPVRNAAIEFSNPAAGSQATKQLAG